MSELVKCDSCKGLKIIYGMGMITTRKCEPCHGIGWVEVKSVDSLSAPQPEHEIIASNPVIIQKANLKNEIDKKNLSIKKRGRPKVNKNG